MHLALVIKISEVYIFSELRDMVMNKVIICLDAGYTFFVIT